MKMQPHKSLKLNFTIDSSELIMFNKGGKHALDLTNDLPEDIEAYDNIEISFQLERSEQARFDHIFGEANKHRAQWDHINASEKKGF